MTSAFLKFLSTCNFFAFQLVAAALSLSSLIMVLLSPRGCDSGYFDANVVAVVHTIHKAGLLLYQLSCLSYCHSLAQWLKILTHSRVTPCIFQFIFYFPVLMRFSLMLGSFWFFFSSSSVLCLMLITLDDVSTFHSLHFRRIFFFNFFDSKQLMVAYI